LWPIGTCSYDPYANLLSDMSSSSIELDDTFHSDAFGKRRHDNLRSGPLANDNDAYGVYANLLSGTSSSSTIGHCNRRSDALSTRMLA
jgi:hypothetical protein